MTAHIHAKAMADYSEDALKTDKPWELWEYNTKHSDDWYSFNKHPQWDDEILYRRKQDINLDDATKKITAFKLLKQIDEKAAEYIKDNGYKKILNKTQDLSCLFIFSGTCQGHRYWYDIYEKLEAAIEEHGI